MTPTYVSVPPSPAPQLPVIAIADAVQVLLAREVAANIYPVEKILAALKISDEEFERIKAQPRFQKLLEQMVLEWESVTNTMERTKVKAGAMVEDWLPEAHTMMHDRTQGLAARTELAKLVTRLAGIGEKDISANGVERVSVTINLGADTKLNFQHDKMIDATPNVAAE